MRWPFDNNTRSIEKKLARMSFVASKGRNWMAVVAILLTTVLFCGLFTLGSGLVESAHRANLVMSGGDVHGRVQHIDETIYDNLASNDLVAEMGYTQKLADGFTMPALQKRDTQFWYYDETAMAMQFVTPTGGHIPQETDEVMMDTVTLELLDVPQKVGAPITLSFTVHDKLVTRTFKLAGWWDSYPGVTCGSVLASKAYVQAHRDELLEKPTDDRDDTGTVTGLIRFHDTTSLREDMEALLVEADYSEDYEKSNYVNAGVNPMFEKREASTDFGTCLALFAASALFIVAGYLIIYNIFQISILRDLHLYGLLKTIGATERQINAVVKRQALWLCVIGLPLGLALGFAVGRALLPLFLSDSRFAVVTPHPSIFAVSALFVLFTVGLSVRKPAKIAKRVSPIEAVRYNDSTPPSKRKKRRSARPGRLQHSMAHQNLGRHKRRTVLVVLSLTLSVVLTNTVAVFATSVNPEEALKNLINYDFRVGQSSLLDNYVMDGKGLEVNTMQKLQALSGFEAGGAEYGCRTTYHSDTTKQQVNLEGDGQYSTFVYGLDDFMWSRLELLDGEMASEVFSDEEAILEGVYVSSRGEMDASSRNHEVGDRVMITLNGETRIFTVVGHVVANEANTYDWVGSCFYLPSTTYQRLTGDTVVKSYQFDVAEEALEATEVYLQEYTNDTAPTLTYDSKDSILAGVKDIQRIVLTVGGSLAVIVGLIGVLNFINTVVTGVYSRRRELAVLQSVGMTDQQLHRMLIAEGCDYVLLTALVAVPLAFVAAFVIVKPICADIWFLQFDWSLLPVALMLALLLLMGMLVPLIACRRMVRKQPVERLKDGM